MKKKTINKRRVRKDAISLDYAMAKFMVPRLEWHLKHATCAPCDDLSLEEWCNILRKILVPFQDCITYEEQADFSVTFEECQKRAEEGFSLLGKYYYYLWD